MAKGIGIKVPKKEVRMTHAGDVHMGDEPIWNTEKALLMDDAEFDHNLRKSMNYYNYFYTSKDLRKHVTAWLEKCGKVTKKEIAIYKQSSDSDTTITACSIIKAHTKGMPLKDVHVAYVLGIVKKICENTEEIKPTDIEVKKAAYVPNIQDRMNEKVSTIIGEIEGQIDLVFANKQPEIKIYDFVLTEKVPQVSVSKIATVIKKLQSELTETESGECPQLKEGYAFLLKKDFKRIKTYLASILSDLETYVNLKKTLKKVKVKKPIAKEKIVGKMKHALECKPLKLVSISPVTILGAKELWCFDTKTRKMIRYVADDHGGSLGVKSSSITGFDPVKSVAKTLRKPEEKLKEFFKATKVELRKFMENIKAVETKATGRIGATMILLKVQ